MMNKSEFKQLLSLGWPVLFGAVFFGFIGWAVCGISPQLAMQQISIPFGFALGIGVLIAGLGSIYLNLIYAIG